MFHEQLNDDLFKLLLHYYQNIGNFNAFDIVTHCY